MFSQGEERAHKIGMSEPQKGNINSKEALTKSTNLVEEGDPNNDDGDMLSIISSTNH